MEGLLEGGTRNASTRVAGKVGWPVNWWPTLEGSASDVLPRSSPKSVSWGERGPHGFFKDLAKKVHKIRPELAFYTHPHSPHLPHPPDAASKSSFSKSSSDIILKMLRQAFRLRQRSIL